MIEQKSGDGGNRTHGKFLPSGAGSIYFITDVENYQIARVKIGYSQDPWTRRGQLRRQYRGRALYLSAELPGSRDHEQALHARFASDALASDTLGREWFRPSRTVVSFMDAANHFGSFFTPELCALAPCPECRKIMRFYAEVAI